MAFNENITLNARCHCGTFSRSVTIPTLALPLKSALCSCTSCRRVTGQLFASFAVIPLPARPDVSNLTAYASSSKLTRYFCPYCGASVANFEEAEWELATGIVEPLTRTDAAGETGGLLNRVLLCLSDTADGGVALWLDKRRLKFMTDRGKREANVAEVMEMSKKSREELARPSSSAAESDAENWLRARCHCGSTKFQISRSSSHDRYPAMLDGCTSCRTAEGFEITSWTRVPLPNCTRLTDHRWISPRPV